MSNKVKRTKSIRRILRKSERIGNRIYQCDDDEAIQKRIRSLPEVIRAMVQREVGQAIVSGQDYVFMPHTGREVFRCLASHSHDAGFLYWYADKPSDLMPIIDLNGGDIS